MEADFSAQEVRECRDMAASSWRLAMSDLGLTDLLIPREIPGYFLDRFAFAARLGFPYPPPGFDIKSTLRSRVQLIDAHCSSTDSLNGWKPDCSSVIEVGESYVEFRRRWLDFALRYQLPDCTRTIVDARGHTWLDIFDRTVFYPRYPAIDSADFFDRIGPEGRNAVHESWGESAAVDFYCLMLQVHESIHFAQTGEPFLCELVQSSIWQRFLTEADLWAFQINPANRKSCIVEQKILDTHSWIFEKAITVWDTSYLVESRCGPHAYWSMCALGELTDRRSITYRQYMELATKVLSGDSRSGYRYAQTLHDVLLKTDRSVGFGVRFLYDEDGVSDELCFDLDSEPA